MPVLLSGKSKQKKGKKVPCYCFIDNHRIKASHYTLHTHHHSRNLWIVLYHARSIFWGLDSFICPLIDLICNPQFKFLLPLCACIFIANGMLRHHLINIHLFNIFAEVECQNKWKIFCFYPFNIIYYLCIKYVIKAL